MAIFAFTYRLVVGLLDLNFSWETWLSLYIYIYPSPSSRVVNRRKHELGSNSPRVELVLVLKRVELNSARPKMGEVGSAHELAARG